MNAVVLLSQPYKSHMDLFEMKYNADNCAVGETHLSVTDQFLWEGKSEKKKLQIMPRKLDENREDNPLKRVYETFKAEW